jgi:hypothetical protein
VAGRLQSSSTAWFAGPSDPSEFAERSQKLEQRSGVAEVIGQYMDTPIYRRIVIAGVDYEFDHIDPPGRAISRQPKERYLTPGIVYARTD